MRLKLIACKAMSREFSYLAAMSENNIDLTFMRQGYHESPAVLNQRLQAEIDAVDSGEDPHTNQYSQAAEADSPQKLEDFDAILLGYGLCSNGIVGLHSEKHTLVAPRAHDCMTMFLGSKERYMQYFNELPGCFWYTGSWIENSAMPGPAYQNNQCAYLREKGYDDEMLEFCLDEMTGWTKNYHYAAYIRMPFFDKKQWQDFTKEAAEFYHWSYRKLEGDVSLMKKFVEGQWNPEEFLIVPPGYCIAASNQKDVIRCQKI